MCFAPLPSLPKTPVTAQPESWLGLKWGTLIWFLLPLFTWRQFLPSNQNKGHFGVGTFSPATQYCHLRKLNWSCLRLVEMAFSIFIWGQSDLEKRNSSGISIIFNAFPPPWNISLFYDVYFLQCSSLSLSLLLNPRFLVRSITLVSLTLLPFSLYNMETEVKVHDRWIKFILLS